MTIADAIKKSRNQTSFEVAYASHAQDAIGAIADAWHDKWDYQRLDSGEVEAWGWTDQDGQYGMSWRLLVKIVPDDDS